MKTAEIFQNGAVLQRRKPIAVWGEAETGRTVTVTLGEASASTTAEEGRWSLTLPAAEAADGLTMTVTDGIETITLTDIAVGEVWLGGGQSNMQFVMNYDAERAALADYHDELLRYYEVPRISYKEQPEDVDFSDAGFWRKAIPEESLLISAVGFYFADQLRDYFEKKIPVGIIGCSWGGTSASAWMSEDYFTQGLSYYPALLEQAKDLDLEKEFPIYRANQRRMDTPEMKAAMDHMMQTPITKPGGSMIPAPSEADKARREQFMRTKNAPFSPFRPAGLYYTMLRTVIPYTLAGFLWYQGEEDSTQPQYYTELLTQMIRCWRDSWGEELPFLIVQLTAFRNPDPGGFMDLNYVPIRRSEEIVSKTVPGTWLACTMDAGMEYDIHPKRKRPVGERLALQAICHVYGGDVESESPEVVSAEKQEGAVVLTLLHCGTGLTAKQPVAGELELIVNGSAILPSEAAVDGDKLLIRAPEINRSSLVTVAYQQQGYCETSLYGSSGLPVRPFMVTL